MVNKAEIWDFKSANFRKATCTGADNTSEDQTLSNKTQRIHKRVDSICAAAILKVCKELQHCPEEVNIKDLFAGGKFVF